MVLLLNDLLEVARRDRMELSVEALTLAIETLRLESTPFGCEADRRSAIETATRRMRQ